MFLKKSDRHTYVFLIEAIDDCVQELLIVSITQTSKGQQTELSYSKDVFDYNIERSVIFHCISFLFDHCLELYRFD